METRNNSWTPEVINSRMHFDGINGLEFKVEYEEFNYLKMGITETTASFQSSGQAEIANTRSEVGFEEDIARFEIAMGDTGFGILRSGARQLCMEIAETTSHSHRDPQHLTPGELSAVNVIVHGAVSEIIRH